MVSHARLSALYPQSTPLGSTPPGSSPLGSTTAGSTPAGSTRIGSSTQSAPPGSADLRGGAAGGGAGRAQPPMTPGEACSQHADLTCLAYTDSDAPVLHPPPGIHIIPPSAYLSGIADFVPPDDCCNFSDKLKTPRAQAVGETTARMSRFFCDQHRRATLATQYRFLPALSHARLSRLQAWRNGSLRWLVLIDDDSQLNVPQLFTLLGSLNHSRPLYMGDFAEWDGGVRLFDICTSLHLFVCVCHAHLCTSLHL